MREDTQSSVVQDLLKQCREHVIYIASFSAGISLLYFAPVLYMLQIYDRVIPTRGLETLGYITLITAFAMVVMAALETVRQRIMARMSVRIERLLAEPVVLAMFEERSRGGGTTGVRALDSFRSAMTGPGALAVVDAPWAPMFLLAVFLVHPLLGLFVMVGAIVLVLYTAASQAKLVRAQTAADEAGGRANLRLDASAPFSSVSRVLGFERALANRHLEERWEAMRKAFEANTAAATMSSVARLLRMGLQSGVLGLGAWLAIEGQITPGVMFAASILGARALQPVDQLVGNWRTLVQGRAAYKKLQGLLKIGRSRDLQTTPLPSPAALLTAEKLSVAAPDGETIVVKTLTLGIGPGEIVGLIGPSGAGKSTLVQALVGAIPIRAGEVRIDGAELRQWRTESLGRHLGYLPQGTALFEGTVADNISRFARWRGIDEDTIGAKTVAAARAAAAHDLILRLPNGYETMLGVNGRGISGGQAQRIALARALYDSPSILVLDEPNAHLDGDGEKALAEAITEVRQRRGCVLLVAQRTGILKLCDRIAVMMDGRITFEGTPDEVLSGVGQKLPPAVAVFRKGV